MIKVVVYKKGKCKCQKCECLNCSCSFMKEITNNKKVEIKKNL